MGKLPFKIKVLKGVIRSRTLVTGESEYHQKQIKTAGTFLSRWNGSQAEMWSITVSLKHLKVLLYRDRDTFRTRNLMISCYPLYFEGPTRWDPCNISVSTTKHPDVKGACFLIEDQSCGLRIVAEGMGISENVKLKG